MNAIAAETVRYIWICKRCNTIEAFEYGKHGGRKVDGQWVSVNDDEHCPGCKRLRKGNSVRGTYNPSKVCSGRCLNAHTGDCECSCGGKNHGSSHVH